MTLTRLAWIWLLLLALVADARAQKADSPRILTLTQAVDLGVENGRELKISAEAVAGAKASLASTRALRLPKVMLESSLLMWDEALELAFEIPGAPPMPPTTIRDRVTSSTSVTLAQPLTPLYPITKLVEIERAGLEAMRADHDTARLDVAERAATTYLQLLLARASSEIAKRSVAQMEAQLVRAQAFASAGVLDRVDVMRLESALAGARQGAIQAETAILMAQDALVLFLGLPRGTTIEPVDDLPEPPGPPPWAPDEAVELARGKRPELRSVKQRVVQARAGRSAAKSKLFPDVVGIATFQHNEGGGTFQPKNAWFVGLTLKWDVWDFGHNWYAVKEAGAQAKRARVASEYLEDQLALQVRQQALQARTAYDALAAARVRLAAAEEAFRLQTARYAGGTVTTTDLLDAETDVTRARLGYATTRYSYFLALAKLARATGQLPDAVPGKR